MSAPAAARGGRAPAAVLRRLARPVTPADRRRERLVAAAVAGCGVFLLAAFSILTVTDELAAGAPGYGDRGQALAPYLAQPGLRGGTAFGVVLLVVPFALLGVQALRTGTAARERRLAALSLAGATRGQVRRIARWEGTRAAVLGGLVAGPAYLALWLVVGAAPPGGLRLLPRPAPELVVVWPAVVAVLGVAGAAAAMLAARPASVTPLGIVRRAPRPPGRSRRWIRLGAVLAFAVAVFCLGGPPRRTEPGIVFAVVAVLLLCGFGGAPFLGVVARRAANRGDLVSTLAAHRLLADLRTPGRVVGVLAAVGLALGVVLPVIASTLSDVAWRDSLFYLGGFGLVGLGAVFSCVVATCSLVVAATEQVLDGRRGIAAFVALGGSPRVVQRVVRRQLVLTAVPPVVLGAAIGGLVPSRLFTGAGPYVVITVIVVAAGAVAAGAVAFASSAVAARAVRPAVLEAARVENLRAP